ncbi:hypothetical protein HID58_033833 [Brassica napus]|uniref:TIR domain-containing protein n=1 Tax=Brassica napus TaxID=3708 RepID=A0ABQ8C0D6_BRANA|nr:hypothetical protein HID58_033833 [Brassica napus]
MRQRRQLQIRGDRPSPLSVHKDSHKIKKPPPHREPVVVSSPKVIHTPLKDFRSVVPRLTGVDNSVLELEFISAFGPSASRGYQVVTIYRRGDISNDDFNKVVRRLTRNLNSVSDLSNSASEFSTPAAASSALKEYDVVLRYRRGCISNDNFITHLHAAFYRRGVSLREDIDEVDAVPECRVLIIFLTSTYVPSNLLNIVEQQSKNPRVVYPIFYGISPSDLISNSNYVRPFHQDEAKRWQAALEEITQMHGYILTDKYVIHWSESDFIDEIVNDALEVLRSNYKKNIIGMDMQIKEILSLLCTESQDVRRIGIWGAVGIGKTAIAEEIFHRISVQYETCVFLKDLHKEVELKGYDAGTSAIEGLFLDMSQLKFDASPNVFDKMCNLRLLKFYFSELIENHGVSLPQGLEYLPTKLRLLHWEHYPISSLPQFFDPKNLIELNMPSSCVKKLWKGKKSLENLKKMRLSYSCQLTKLPRLTSAQNLELLDLEGCKSLVSISHSICYLKKLVSLNLKDCSNLESVPSTSDLEFLEVLNLSGCSKLENFPEISPNVKELYLGGTVIQEIPSAIKNLVLLEKLDLENSRRLVILPTSMCKLKHLETLNLSGCSSLEHFPDLSRKMKCLKSLDLCRTAIKELPSSISYLTALEEVRFVGCKSLVRLPDNAWSLRFKVEFRQIDTEKFSKLWNRLGWLKKVHIS